MLCECVLITVVGCVILFALIDKMNDVYNNERLKYFNSLYLRKMT